MKQQVYYHSNCLDGTGAAAAFKSEKGDEFSYHPINYSDLKDPETIAGNMAQAREIWFLDFCPDQTLLELLIKADGIEYIYILDHHKTAVDMLQEFCTGVVHPKLRILLSEDGKTCGAMISKICSKVKYNLKVCSHTLEQHSVVLPFSPSTPNANEEQRTRTFLSNLDISFFTPLRMVGQGLLYSLINIRDTWDKSNPEFKEDADALQIYIKAHGLLDVDKFLQHFKTGVIDATALQSMKSLQILENSYADSIVGTAHVERLNTDHGEVTCVICFGPPSLGSAVGEASARRYGIDGNKVITFMLGVSMQNRTAIIGARSINIAVLDVVKIMGGGGHANACGVDLNNVRLNIKGNSFGDVVDAIKNSIIDHCYTAYGDNRSSNNETFALEV